ncbi:Por secretion system C-terminal sorting domain-containing protein [Lutibacter agarilyticus]|uniref:Por secretion system C-terminal sorting domain-containing protein n=1 Tax=Lutibacter agarilyticus TaxID=1109740 RepID=A0A238W3X3_9FLAO|nr:LamG-like jellyroll fold domain-containing protein [Lutibacter agarilyticus]SNR41262.1 Por secretion system C-terminal sorting domain-containing protein [Lutibacter agarilyticus]
MGLFNNALKCFNVKLIALLLFVAFTGNAQVMQVNILGGAEVASGTTISITAGNSITFRITNTRSNCGTLKVEDIILSDQANFSVSHKKLSYKVKSSACKNGNKYLDFTVTNTSGGCVASTNITIENNKDTPDFSFTVAINSSPTIYVLGGSPWADINHGDTATSPTNGTYFGVVEEGNTVTRRYFIANIGSCDLDITSLSSSNPDFIVSSPYTIPYVGIPSYYYIVIDVAFAVDNLTPAGTNTSIISVGNTDNTTFTFTVSGEVFDFNIPGPGGITADFRLWLKTTRGITKDGSDKVSEWKDLGTNPKHATQPTSSNQPTYIDSIASNINFNPVIKFENDGGSLEQYLYNDTNGFYSQDMFVVMIPNETMTNTSSRNTIFAGVSKKDINDNTFDVDDITGVGFGDYTIRSSTEVLTYAQDVDTSVGVFNSIVETGSTYSSTIPGVLNVRNNAAATGQEILFKSNVLTTVTAYDDIAYSNVGYVDGSLWQGTPYWIGRNHGIQGSLNGSIAEVMTFAERLSDTNRQKVESYLAIKYGVTLGVSTQAQKNYVNSFDTAIWDISSNSDFNYHVAGIGRDDGSDLNQKQSKSINNTNEVTIGLGGLFTTNTVNPNEFKKDGDFLVWGCNNGAFTGSNTNTVTIATGLTTNLTRIDRKWKIVESNEDVDGEVGNIYMGIPATAFSSFTKNATEEYVLIVADNENFANEDIIDVIPLKINIDAAGNPILDKEGNQVYNTWYDFHDTKFFTFGKATQLTGNKSVSLSSGDFLVGEYNLNLSEDAFTISVWVKSPPNASTRAILAKGNKMQLRLNSTNNIEVLVDEVDDNSPSFVSNMALDSKWHQLTFVYNSGTIFLYVDGILDHSVQNIIHPSPNYNRFTVGGVYIDKNTINHPFIGEIDEVYVWDHGLTQEQIRSLMNQELERFNSGGIVYATGKFLPQGASSNEVTTIPWSDLRAYYDFNSFYGSTVEGLTNDRYFLRLNYLTKAKSIVDSQTAPLPYISAEEGPWDSPATWVNGTENILPNSLGLDGSTYIDWNIVYLEHNINSGDRDIKVLGLIVPQNVQFTIADPVVTDPIELNDGQGLTITHYLELDGVIDLVGESQLVQSEGSVLDEDSGGYIERDQQGTANSFNYNYWSSSVSVVGGNIATLGTGVESTNTGASVSEFLLDGTNSTSSLTVDFGGAHTYADGSYTGAKRISTYWLYKFWGASEDYNAWSPINENNTLLPGEGFTMKGTSGNVTIATNQNYVFKGRPNNGGITLAISEGQERLIGNPYPSAIDADEFILDNIKTDQTFIDASGEEKTGRRTENVFNGALYFWHHFGEQDSHNLKEYVGGYATYTLLGGTEAYSTDDLINNATPLVGGGKVPERYIPANQGFFVSAYLPSTIVGTTTTVDGGTIMFKNSQRVFERERFTGTNDGSLFFKTSKKSTIIKQEKMDKRSKIRLKFNSPKGYNRQLLLGLDVNATNNFDLGYDAPIADIGSEDLFWVFNEAKFVIQAVNNFNNEQELALGLITKSDGVASIEVESLENIAEGIEIYIKDNLLDEIHQINSKPFEINLLKGEYLDRFYLIFKSKKVSKEENGIEEAIKEEEATLIQDVQLYMNNTSAKLQISRNTEVKIIEIQAFNNLGQLMSAWNKGFDTFEFSLPFNKESGVYFIQIKTNIGLINKKVIVK